MYKSGEWRKESCLKRHILAAHSTEHPCSCEVCKKSFIQEGSLREHQHVHNRPCVYLCDLCNRSFTKQSILHQRIHGSDHPYSRDVYGKVFGRKSSPKRHKGIHNGACLCL